MFAVGREANDVQHTESIWIAAPQLAADAQRESTALAPSTQQSLIPAARRQLIPDEGGDAPRIANRQPRCPLAASSALPPVSGHGRRDLQRMLMG
jgi:hypothetical protein